MRFVPFENVTYKTELKPKEAIRRISELVQPKKSFRMKISEMINGSSEDKPYQGRISENTFDISRVIK